MTDKEKLAEQYNAFCEELGLTKPVEILNACVVLDNVYQQGKHDATVWHYPSRGELPPRGKQVLCWLWNGNYCLAYKREDDEWTTNGRFTFDGVRCWQYIIPPKEEA